jgi:hypothetical protein
MTVPQSLDQIGSRFALKTLQLLLSWDMPHMPRFYYGSLGRGGVLTVTGFPCRSLGLVHSSSTPDSSSVLNEGAYIRRQRLFTGLGCV